MAFVRKNWVNKETSSSKKLALNRLKKKIDSSPGGPTRTTFTSVDNLALRVIEALADWEDKGRPGARKTFASISDYFKAKSPSAPIQLLDFNTTLLGRENEVQALREFAASEIQRAFILSGRGGIGKSKILHDWAKSSPEALIFLKDEPLWYEDSEKEISIDTKILVVDDAHRHDDLGTVMQILHDRPANRSLKIVVSTRPGGAMRLSQQIYREIDPAEVTSFPELQELTTKQSRALAEQVLGPGFRRFADYLAQIGSNSPFVIVAGGRLIASRKIDPSSLTTLGEFRATVFNCFLEELNLQGPEFAIDPPLDLLHLVAALGPVDAQSPEFQKCAEGFFERPLDEVLSTIDALSKHGVLTTRPKPVRIVPDVLGDFILEQRCLGGNNCTTHYADRVYDQFGAHSLKNLMRNLAELDWRVGRQGETGLGLLDAIWAEIHKRFDAGDEYLRHRILTELSSAAIYQPSEVIALIRTAIDRPVVVDDAHGLTGTRSGQDYVLSVLPSLLEATAHHPSWLRESVDTLWELSRRDSIRDSDSNSAKAVIKRLSSWQLFKNVWLNFAMLLQAIRLAKRSDAFDGEFNPFVVIGEILEREGEINSWEDENTISFGSFGLNYEVVGPVRENALDYLETAVQSDGSQAYRAVELMERLLHNFLNRGTRVTSNEEIVWQNRERSRCLNILVARFVAPASTILRAQIYDAVRSGTAINCPEQIQEASKAELEKFEVDDAVRVVDAICTGQGDLPILSRDLNSIDWERPINTLMSEGRLALERLESDSTRRVSFVMHQLLSCMNGRVKVSGFNLYMRAFLDDPEFLSEMADSLVGHPEVERLVNHLSGVLYAMRAGQPVLFRQKAWGFLNLGSRTPIRAAAFALRVFEDAVGEDVALIKAYGGFHDPVVKQGALGAIAYMGKFANLQTQLLDAAIAIDAGGDPQVASELADAFGPYGVPLTLLNSAQAAALASQFLPVKDWDSQQQAIPRFLSKFVSLFPDETFELLLNRIRVAETARLHSNYSFHTFGFVHLGVSFEAVRAEKRLVP